MKKTKNKIYFASDFHLGNMNLNQSHDRERKIVKWLNQIKKDAKVLKKEISKEEAEKILKAENEKSIKEQEKLSKDNNNKEEKKSVASKKNPIKKANPASKKSKTTKKVSKK